MPRLNTDILLFIGPSGGGKTSLINSLRHTFPESFSFSVSHTTRKPRPGERDGVDYHFVSVDTFRTLVKTHQMVEHSTLVPGSPAALKNEAAPITDRTYGTSKAALYKVLSQNKVVLMDTDVDGALNILDFCRRHSMAELRRIARKSGGGESEDQTPPSSPADERRPLRCRIVFVAPPSLDTLEQRLRARGTETDASLKLRMDASAHWIEWADTHPEYINYRLVNDSLPRCTAELNAIVKRDILRPQADVPSKL